MNKLVKLGLVAGGAISLYFVFHRGTSISITNKELRELAEEEIPVSYDTNISAKYDAYAAAKKAADEIRNADKAIWAEGKADIQYQTALMNEKNAKDAFDTAKKALGNYKPDTTQVAVGSGDSAIAINLQNNSQKVMLETAVREAQSKYDLAKNHKSILDSQIQAKVLASHTDEQKDILSNESNLYWEYKKAVSEKKSAVNSVINNKDWYYKQLSEVFKKNTTKTDVLGEAIGLSAFPVAVLAYIWCDTYTKLKLLSK